MELSDITLFEFFNKEDINLDYPMAEEIPVPTEFVVTEPKICTPKFARVYSTNMYLLNGDIVEYIVLAKQPHFRGTSHYDQLMLVEVWINHDDDGHIAYSHRGYRYVPQSQLEIERKYNVGYAYQAGNLPRCMWWHWGGEAYPVDDWKKDKEWMEENK